MRGRVYKYDLAPSLANVPTIPHCSGPTQHGHDSQSVRTVRYTFNLLYLTGSLSSAPTGQGNSSTAIIEQGTSPLLQKGCPTGLPSSATTGYNATVLPVKRMPVPPLRLCLHRPKQSPSGLPVRSFRKWLTRTYLLLARQISNCISEKEINGLTLSSTKMTSRRKALHLKAWRYPKGASSMTFTHSFRTDCSAKTGGGEIRLSTIRSWWTQNGTSWIFFHNPRKDVELFHWSDVAYLMYVECSKFAATDPRQHPGFFYPPPQWIYFPEARASDVALRALQSSLNSQYERGLRSKPGVTFPIGSKAYDLMIISPLIYTAVLFLTRHRYRFGPCVISSITVWDSGARTPDGTQIPDILMYMLESDDTTSTMIPRNREDDELYNNCGAHRERHYYTNYFPQWSAPEPASSRK
ncbi:hypothetical protein CERZMDRAFT_86540 [Cercospora zeae-maydis SCOH1-5]|uniref:Uncharacterized protein n=1 Tax=Cercospora zeae-maydis SCOH1-5 TaxID=717836 RepID=A0A6A6F920_9PEZI|nr:hypothetical protein CERZMDRAFT_86540 [Cercospora zeae-maydis SCOH1-5]